MPSIPLRAQPRADEQIYLIGTSGHPNLGDELIAAGWLRHLARTRPSADVWLDCPRPAMASHLFAGMHPRLRTTDSLFRLIWETTDMTPEEAEQHVDVRTTQLGTPRYDLGLLDARAATSVHVIGGGYVNDIWPRHQLLLRAARRIAEMSGARTYATGLGLMPTADAAAVRESLEAFDHATVRDAPSAELSGMAVVPDDSLLDLDRLPGFSGGHLPAGENSDVWVCLQSDMAEETTFAVAVEAVRAYLTPLRDQGRTLRYLEAIPGVDRIAFDRLSDLIPEANFTPFIDLWRYGLDIGSDQTWVTTRFHLHLLAAACGARGTALEIDPDYYHVKHQSLLDLGTGWSTTPMGETTLGEPSGGTGFRPVASRLYEEKVAEAEALFLPPSATTAHPASAPTTPRSDARRASRISRR